MTTKGLTDSQVEALSRPFEIGQVKERQGGFNRNTGRNEMYKYVSAEDVLARLREVFGLRFDTDVPGLEQNGMQSFIVVRSYDDNGNPKKTEVVLPVRLSWPDSEDPSIMRSVIGWGSKEVMGEVGDAFKAAQSKAVKSAAKVLGVPIDGGDVHGEDDETAEPAEKPAFPSRTSPVPPRPGAGTANKPSTNGPAKPGPKPPGKPAQTEEEEQQEEKPSKPAPGKPGATKPTPPKPGQRPGPAPKREPEPEPEPEDNQDFDEIPPCSVCGGAIEDSEDEEGNVYTAAQIVEISSDPEAYGAPTCAGCMAEAELAEE